MGDERSNTREGIVSGLHGLGSFLKSRGIPGKARLNRAAPSLRSSDPQSRAQHTPGSAADISGTTSGPSSGPPAVNGSCSSGGGGGDAQQVGPQQPAPPGSTTPPVQGTSGGTAAGSSAAVSGGQQDASLAGGSGGLGSRACSSIRLAKFQRLLSEPLIDLDMLRELAWSGIPPELRPQCWRLLLGYLPPNRSRQAAVLARKRREYLDMIPQLYDIDNGLRSEEEVGALRQVSVDVPRTAPHVPFFHEALVQESLRRMLYIWGIRHPASGYVQGMNDLATPFLGVFLSELLPGGMETWRASDLTQQAMLDVEADCYWCLGRLLEGMQDNYTAAQPGIQRTVFRVRELISANNAPLSGHLEAEGVDFLQFAFRWVNCLLVREVPYGAALRLWDTYLAEGGRLPDFLVYVCASFLACWQPAILGREFQELLMFLQRLPTADWGDDQVESVLSHAYVLRNTWGSAHSARQT